MHNLREIIHRKMLFECEVLVWIGVVCSYYFKIKQLEKLGYQKVQEHNGVVVFINDPSKPQTFSKSKVSYSGIMTMT